MLEPKIEKKIDGQETEAQKLISDLKARHAEEIKIIREENNENEGRLMSELEVKYANQLRIWRSENAEKEMKLISDLELRHAQEVQRLLRDNREREENLFNEYKAGLGVKTCALVKILLRIKSQRDMILLAASWIAIGAIVVFAVSGLMYGIFSKIFTFAALAGFIGSVISARQDLKSNSKHLKLAMEGVVPPDSIWEEDDGKPARFLIFGLISGFLTGFVLYINPLQQGALISQTTGPSVQKPVALVPETTATTKNPPEASSKTPPTVKQAGNGGIFAGGISR